MNKKIICLGYGWVGKEVCNLFPNCDIYDPAITTSGGLGPGRADHLVVSEQLMKQRLYDVAFVCVPTPSLDSGALDTFIVEEAVRTVNANLIVIRSTVNPGTCWALSKKYNKRIVMQPEYLGETPAHPLMQSKDRPFLILGGCQKDTRTLIELYTTVYNANTTIRQVTALEAEIIKLSENRAIAFKVMQCHELFLACEAAGVDYYTIRDAVYGDDPRFNLWWTFIFPDKLGFNSSKCLVKDVPAWNAWAESAGINPTITRKLVQESNSYGDIAV